MNKPRVLVTRAAGQAGDLAEELASRGATVAVVPVLEIAPPTSWDALDAGLRSLATYDAVAFTSANAVERFFARFYDVLGTCDLASLPERTRAFAVGPKTAEALARAGVPAEPVPDEHRGEALAEAILRCVPRIRRVLVPRAEEGREELAAALRRAGARVDVAAAYRTMIPSGARDALRDALATHVDAIALASPSAASHLVELLGGREQAKRALAGSVIAAIGLTTAARVRELGLGEPVVPARATAASLAQELLLRLSS